ncbi:hypothetical protein A8C32_02925 [Flavivirga aquatica]|uniref:DUF922 domain-containing protein n=1 Tax=Flavivirga aquatica TaxID=1849968 RepID=A0A1E5TAS3_9FLAO|nr:DUF922 domain-containing protein [Flavivirga aquatica]OEK08417.1 hypothetical protein A8C32_02925 [Flavivirga aquatica]
MNLYIKTILLFVTISCSVYSQEKVIIWGTKILEPESFKASLNKYSKYDANSHLKIKSKFTFDRYFLHSKIVAEFNMSKSRVKGRPSEYLIKHEQIHFDITEYHARLFRKELSTYKFESFSKIRSTMRMLKRKYFKLSKKMHAEYDADTNHSINEEIQKEWNTKAKFLLEQVSDFSNPNVSLDLSYLK